VIYSNPTMVRAVVNGAKVRLASGITIPRTPEEVGSFLGDISNVEKWDPGVGSTNTISGRPGVGFEFDTLGRSDSRVSGSIQVQKAPNKVRKS
jgi:hypothetical protein